MLTSSGRYSLPEIYSRELSSLRIVWVARDRIWSVLVTLWTFIDCLHCVIERWCIETKRSCFRYRSFLFMVVWVCNKSEFGMMVFGMLCYFHSLYASITFLPFCSDLFLPKFLATNLFKRFGFQKPHLKSVSNFVDFYRLFSLCNWAFVCWNKRKVVLKTDLSYL